MPLGNDEGVALGDGKGVRKGDGGIVFGVDAPRGNTAEWASLVVHPWI